MLRNTTKREKRALEDVFLLQVGVSGIQFLLEEEYDFDQ